MRNSIHRRKISAIHALSVCLAMIVLSSGADAAVLKGRVVAGQKRGKPVAGVTVGGVGANQTVTGDDGLFTLSFKDLKPGSGVSLSFAKDGWDVVNHSEVANPTLVTEPDSNPLVVVLSELPGLVAARRAYYDVYVGAAVEQSLSKRKSVNAQAARAQAKGLADRLSSGDVSGASPNSNAAIAALVNGDIEAAIRILEVARDRGKPELKYPYHPTEAQISDHLLEARLLAMQEEFGLAQLEYEAVVKRVPDSFRARFDLASFELDTGRPKDALADFERALAIAQKSTSAEEPAGRADRAATLAILGDTYRRLGNLEKAQAAYEEAIRLRRQLSAGDPVRYRYYLASTLTHLGTLLTERKQFNEAGAALGEAWSTFVAKGAGQYLKEQAEILNSRGSLYLEMRDPEQARVVFAQALNIRRQLAEENPERFTPSYAESLNNQCVVEQTSLKMCAEAVATFRKLVQRAPALHNRGLATSLAAQANVQLRIGQPKLATQSLQESYEIRKSLASTNIASALNEAADTATRLAGIWMEQSDLDKAAAGYTEALDFYDKAAALDAPGYQPMVASTLFNLAILYSRQHNQTLADESCRKLAGLYLELARYSDDCTGPDNEVMRRFIEDKVRNAKRRNSST